MAGEAPTRYSETVPADPRGLDRLHDLLGRARADWPGVAAIDFDMLETAIIELAGNTASHGRAAGATEMTLTVDVADHELVATIVDAGAPLDVDLGASLPGELDEAGRGIAIACRALDSIAYEHSHGTNRWHLRRTRS